MQFVTAAFLSARATHNKNGFFKKNLLWVLKQANTEGESSSRVFQRLTGPE